MWFSSALFCHPEPRRRRGIFLRSLIIESSRDPSSSARLRMTSQSLLHFARQGPCIEWGVHLGVVVEVDKDIAFLRFCFGGNQLRIPGLLSLAPKFQSRCPPIQRAIAVTAGVELGVAMETAINEICGQVFGIRPLPSGISENESHIEFVQQ